MGQNTVVNLNPCDVGRTSKRTSNDKIIFAEILSDWIFRTGSNFGTLILGVNSCGEWTVFEELTGAYSFISVEKWHEFAENDELIVAGFNDDVTYGEFIVFRNGRLVKYFSYDQLSDISFNAGVYDYKINYWTDVAGFIEDDKFYFSDKGEVLVYKGVFL